MSASVISTLTGYCVKYVLHITQQGNYHISLMKLRYNPNNPMMFYKLLSSAFNSEGYIESKYQRQFVFDSIQEAEDAGIRACKEVIDNRIKKYQDDLNYLQERINKLKSKKPKRTFKDLINK